MKCIKCGAENNDSNKFCTNCGYELIDKSNPQEIICESCGAKNKPENNYCISCGESLKVAENINAAKSNLRRQNNYNRAKSKRKSIQHSTVESKNYSSAKKIGLKPVLITAAVIIISYFVVTLIDSRNDTNTSAVRTIEMKSANPAVEANVYEIASKFVCSCGTCGEESLEKCTCTRAVEERQFIRDYLEKNGKQEDIVVALANRYGYLKSAYAKNYKVDVSKVWTGDALKSSSNLKDIIK